MIRHITSALIKCEYASDGTNMCRISCSQIIGNSKGSTFLVKYIHLTLKKTPIKISGKKQIHNQEIVIFNTIRRILAPLHLIICNNKPPFAIKKRTEFSPITFYKVVEYRAGPLRAFPSYGIFPDHSGS